MIKCTIVLDEEKVKSEGLYDVNELKETLKSICLSEQLLEEEPNHYVLDEAGRSGIGARMMLLGKMEKSNILQNLKEWKDFDNSESDDGSFIESDMLKICKESGLL